MEREEKGKNWLNPEVDRRKFLAISGALASAAALSSTIFKTKEAAAITLGQYSADPVETAPGVTIVRSFCQMCHGRCGLQAKVVDGVLVKLDGNPYHPNNMHPDERLPYSTDATEANKSRGRMCLKGQAGIQTLYDPYRVKAPLKRVGPRGSGQWKTVSWDEALSDIASRLLALRDLTTPANPDAPEAGPVANQVLFAPGRTVEGDFSDRIWKDGFGTANYRLDHTSICEVDHHVAYELVTWDKTNKAGRKNHFKADFLSSEYVLLFGSNPLESNFAFVPIARKLMEMKRNGGKYVVVDPRFSHSAAQANGGWIPVKPGTDGALALGMARWIIDNKKYDEKYLKNANKAAATADGEKTWTDATWLVDLSTNKYLRDDVLGGDGSKFVVWDGTQGLAVKSDDTTTAVEGTLDTGTVTVGGKSCKSAFTLFKERVQEKTIAEYASICGIESSTIESLAREFTSHGKKAGTEHYRGTVQHTNGAYSSLAVIALDTLIGNYDWKGGSTAGGGAYANNTGVVDVTKVPKKVSYKGVRIDRTKLKFYETDGKSFFQRDGYPAKRPWFPYATHGNFQEAIPSAADGYPYSAKAIITYWNAWPYSTPALKKVFEDYVKDESKLPLFVAISLNIGEVAALADYILPDTTYLEKFAFTGTSPAILAKATAFQQPVVGSFDADMNYTPILPNTKMYMDILIELAKKMNLPSVGAGAFEDGGSLDRAWDFTRRQLDNLAKNATSALGRTVTVEEIKAKGGAFEDPGKEYSGDYVKNTYGNEIHLYIEELATTKDSMTGKTFDPLPKYEVPRHADDTPVDDSAYPLHLITYKSVRHGQARTATNPWLMLLAPENYVEINSTDAKSLGISTGDKVRVTSASNTTGIVGYAKVMEGIRPGVVAISHHYGHWELGSRPHIIDGAETEYDASRGAGLQANLVMRLDAKLGNVSLQSKVGGSCSFYDTKVKVEKV
ncbi:MAG: hypothetical protein A3G93_14305 [Nitrospinae bacterium RIFCSPLOWO2_12_FULL_45_22]|nr:MAG: hypothetical protein A3G93_14305 [Nitrospinae bacterium RIFCSPLOWO2_12_FULL_45_22]